MHLRSPCVVKNYKQYITRNKLMWLALLRMCPMLNRIVFLYVEFIFYIYFIFFHSISLFLKCFPYKTLNCLTPSNEILGQKLTATSQNTANRHFLSVLKTVNTCLRHEYEKLLQIITITGQNMKAIITFFNIMFEQIYLVI